MKYYIGLSLAANSSTDSGVAVLDSDGNLIMLDKLYKMNDVAFFFENFTSIRDCKICVSMPADRTMLEGRWRILSKPYQMVATNTHMPNRDNWTQRYSTRGCEFFTGLSEKGIPVDRFELYITRQTLHLNSCYKERSPADCKFLQQILRTEWNIDLPVNMMPMSHMEAIVGALLAKESVENPDNIRKISHFRNFNVIDFKECPTRFEFVKKCEEETNLCC